MKRSTVLWALVVVNVMLTIVLFWKFGGENVAHAQAGRRGDYLMIPAKGNGLNNGLVYMLDTRNGVLGGLVFDHSRNELLVMDPVDLNRVLEGGVAPQKGKTPPRR